MSLNEYKILKLKCIKYYGIIEKQFEIKNTSFDEITKARFGFYPFILECITGESDIEKLVEMIIDYEFNEKIFKVKNNDKGVDAVHINYDENIISLFSFKYREKYNDNKSQSENDFLISAKFSNALLNGNIGNIKGKTKDKLKEIYKCLQSNEEWKLKYYMVTNDEKPINSESEVISQFKDIYGMEVRSICLPDISNFLSLRPEPVNAKIILNTDSLLSYQEHNLSSDISFVCKISLPDLVRITCNNEEIRNKYNLEDYSVIKSEKINYSILYDNVRGFLGETTYNKQISNTILNDPTKFFMYNNGLTMIVKDVTTKIANANKKMILILDDMQIVNGGQTLRIIYNFMEKYTENALDRMAEASALLRIYKVGQFDNNRNNKLGSEIAQFTNSQNKISPMEIKSLAIEQIELEKVLDDKKIVYSRKKGAIGYSDETRYNKKISMEKFGQILMAHNNMPHQATNQKSKIFTKYYDQLFISDKNLLDNAYGYINEYFEIADKYKKLENYDYTEQKNFYIIYLKKYFNDKSLNFIIDFLEQSLTEYDANSEKSKSRKMITAGFKDYIDSKLKINKKS